MAATFGPVAALLAGVAFLLTGHGLLLTVVPLRAALDAFSQFEIGLLGSAYYIGFVGGCFLAPYVILRAGHIRAFAAMIALCTVSAMVLPLWVEVWFWAAARAVTGACLAGLYMVIESWLNDRASNQNRGLIMSSYIVVNFSAITLGQLIVTLETPAGFQLFTLAAMAIALATIPVALTRSAQPAPITLVRFRPREMFRQSPVGIVGVTLIGFATGAFWALGVIYATGRGLSTEGAAVFMSVAVIGGAIAQWPIGRISDRVDRRLVLATLLVAAALFGLLLAFAPLGPVMLFVGGFLAGATLLPGYSIAAAHAYDRAEPSAYVETSAGVLLANGLGSVVGPIGASLLMDAIGVGGLFVFTAAAQIALAVFAVTRLRQRVPPPAEAKTGFNLAATAIVGGIITPEPLDPYDPAVAVPPAPGRDEPPPGPGGRAAVPRPDHTLAEER